MSQIHSALTYYWEHKAILDADIERRSRYIEKMQQKAPPSPIAQRLRKQGLLE
jgi:hypothetical protein